MVAPLPIVSYPQALDVYVRNGGVCNLIPCEPMSGQRHARLNSPQSPITNTIANIRVSANDPFGSSAQDQIKDRLAIGKIGRRLKLTTSLRLVVRRDCPPSAELASLSYPKLRSLIR